MDIFDEIFKVNNNDSINKNNEIADLVLKEVIDNIDGKIIFEDDMYSLNKLICLKEQFIYNSDYVDLFFSILSKYNYNMKNEIRDAIFLLAFLRNPNRNKKIINTLLHSPIIQDISFNGRDEFQIYSDEYGNISFNVATLYFKRNGEMKYYIRKNILPNRCHEHTYFMSNIFEDYYSITSLCKYYFKDYYYHSYTYDSTRDVIIDLCYNSVIPKDTYYRLYDPCDISVILNSQVQEELTLTNSKTSQKENRCSLLKIALYKQYLDSIGYVGDLKDAPTTTEKILKK